jgi:hypothetical protein
MNLQEHIRRIIKEETDQDDNNSRLKDKLKSVTNELGFENAFKMVGGIKNYVKIVYDGDLKSFFKQNGIDPYLIVDEYYWQDKTIPNMYISEFLINELNIDTNDLGSLGTFKWGPKKNPYVAFCDLNTVREKFNNGFNYYRVKGRGYGKQFGYGNTSQTIGKTYRKQIFKQIIDKYDLDSYK